MRNTDGSRRASQWNHPQVLKDCLKATGELGLEERTLNSLRMALKSGFSDIQLAMVLFLCPYVENMDLVLRHEQSSLLLRPLCPRPCNDPTRLLFGIPGPTLLREMRIQSNSTTALADVCLPSVTMAMSGLESFHGKRLKICCLSQLFASVDMPRRQEEVF